MEGRPQGRPARCAYNWPLWCTPFQGVPLIAATEVEVPEWVAAARPCPCNQPNQALCKTVCYCCRFPAGLTDQGITVATTQSTELSTRNWYARTDTLVHAQVTKG